MDNLDDLENRPEDSGESPFEYDWESVLTVRKQLQRQLLVVQEAIVQRRALQPAQAVNHDFYAPTFDPALARLIQQEQNLQLRIQACAFEEVRRKDNMKWTIIAVLMIASVLATLWVKKA